MRFSVLTLFPGVFEPYVHTSILGRAQAADLLTVESVQIRDFATDTHKTVDDTPYGGGAGMVMQVGPIDRALASIPPADGAKRKTVVLSARGATFTQQKATTYAALDELVLIAGRYEGIDQRVADYLADEEISIGSYVLAGGELPALVVIEAVARLLPGVLGNPASLAEESHSVQGAEEEIVQTEYPQYTKPDEYKGWKVPEVLLSGNHAEIAKWRAEQRGRATSN